MAARESMSLPGLSVDGLPRPDELSSTQSIVPSDESWRDVDDPQNWYPEASALAQSIRASRTFCRFWGVFVGAMAATKLLFLWMAMLISSFAAESCEDAAMMQTRAQDL